MASTRLDPEVLATMVECLNTFGNPSSKQHIYGRQAADLINNARQQTAASINAHNHEIIWTSGATESINLAIKGASLFYQRKGKHIVTLASEHKAVINSCASLENQGFSTTYLKPNQNGLLNLEDFRTALRPDTLLASIAWVNNETGVIQNIAEIVKIAHKNGTLIHVDGAQALGKVPINVKEIPIDLLSLSAHKAYGPKGVGALYIKGEPRIRLLPLIHGGEQEKGLRSGTLATHQIVGMGKACELAQKKQAEDHQNISYLSQLFLNNLSGLDGVHLNGDLDRRVPHCLNLSFDGIVSETLMLSLPEVALSSGSACHAVYSTPSHVLSSMGIKPERALSAVRISLGRFTTIDEVQEAVRLLKQKIENLSTKCNISPISYITRTGVV